MSRTSRALALILLCLAASRRRSDRKPAEISGKALPRNSKASIVSIFAENGVLYLDESSHRQLLDFDKAESDGAPDHVLQSNFERRKASPLQLSLLSGRTQAHLAGVRWQRQFPL